MEQNSTDIMEKDDLTTSLHLLISICPSRSLIVSRLYETHSLLSSPSSHLVRFIGTVDIRDARFLTNPHNIYILPLEFLM